MPRSTALAALLAALLAGGCTTYGLGQSALRQGNYGEAASHFEQVLAQDPGRADALIGLGVARYEQGDLDEAVKQLGPAVVKAPRDQTGQLYLALAYLRKGEDGLAEERLSALDQLKPAPRLAAQVDRTLKLLHQGYPLTAELRQFVAASLEDQAAAAREVREAQQLARSYVPVYPFAFRDCFVTRHHRVVCF